MNSRRTTPEAHRIPKHAERCIQKPELLLDKWLSEPSGGQLTSSMKFLRLGKTFTTQCLVNLADDVWLGRSEPDNQKMELALRMMKERIRILTKATGEYCRLTADLGWDIDTIEKSASILMPYLDVSERTCYTYYGHQYRSMQYADIILNSRGVQGDERAVIMLGALLHDIGKSGVSGSILRKAGKPSDTEQKAINKHAEYGSRIITRLVDRLSSEENPIWTHGQAIAGVVFAHQEKFSGNGYPRGLVGDAIDLGARVAGLCDSIDAMSSKRIYRLGPSATYKEVEEIARKEMDKHFNRNLVRDFLGAARCREVLDRIYTIIRSAGGVP